MQKSDISLFLILMMLGRNTMHTLAVSKPGKEGREREKCPSLTISLCHYGARPSHTFSLPRFPLLVILISIYPSGSHKDKWIVPRCIVSENLNPNLIPKDRESCPRR